MQDLASSGGYRNVGFAARVGVFKGSRGLRVEGLGFRVQG